MKLPMAWYAARFAEWTGTGVDTCSEGYRTKFRGLYTWTEEWPRDRKGFYLYGGTGCGKTTLARLFARDYRVVNCLDVTAAYEAKNMEGIRGYYADSICFDDLGAEQKAYGKNAMEDVVQMRYDLMVAARKAYDKAADRLEEIRRHGEGQGWSRGMLSDLDRCKAEMDGDTVIRLCRWGIDLDNALSKREEALGRMPITCFTSNLDYPQVCQRYGDRMESRIREMCDFIDLSQERDHRIKED